MDLPKVSKEPFPFISDGNNLHSIFPKRDIVDDVLAEEYRAESPSPKLPTLLEKPREIALVKGSFGQVFVAPGFLLASLSSCIFANELSQEFKVALIFETDITSRKGPFAECTYIFQVLFADRTFLFK